MGVEVKTRSGLEQSAPVANAKLVQVSEHGCTDRRSDCKTTAFLCDDPIYKPIMAEQCARTCNLCVRPRAKRFVVVDPPAPTSSTHSGKAAGVFTVAEIFMSALETVLKGIDILLVAVLKYVREGRAAISEAVDALKQAAANHRPRRSADVVPHATEHEF
ncbi:hypothetical protein AAVH_07311 [Aphelenchoides avenae]|nr:hypothetical protein AAVH_07311 [Aphelenchus avenae]